MYVRLPSPQSQAVAPPAPERVVNGRKRCSKCRRWLLLCEFESKGRRDGRQVRRGTCMTCRGDRQTPVVRLEEWERTCINCGRTQRVSRFYACGTAIGGVRPYRRLTCVVCCRKQGRDGYRLKRHRAHKPYTPRPEWRKPDSE